jgi:hypothetical protein
MANTSWRTFVPVLGVAALASVSLAYGQAPAAAGQPPAVETRDTNLRAYAELLRADVRAQKVAIITEVMQFTDAEDAKFWPIYREYDVELNRINDDRVGLIEEYAKAFGKLTDADADRIATRALEFEANRNALKQKYYARFKQALSPKTAARFLQVENQLLLLIDLQIAASLPLAQ